uniref:Scaffolding protein n=1 Tax=viral metagenome TaxID=1070528 RepID=A0A6M3IEV6_9ZZZZ
MEKNTAIVTVDDPNVPEDDAAYTAEDFAQRFGVALPAAKPAAEEAEDETEGVEEAPEEAVVETAPAVAEAKVEATEAPPKPEPPKERLFTQAEVNAIQANDKRHARELEAVTGKTIPQLIADQRKAAVTDTADKFGMTEDEAQAVVHNAEEVRRLTAEVEQGRADQRMLTRQATYRDAKAKHMSNPDVRRYEAEIDAFAQAHAGYDFQVAALAVLGNKMLSGEAARQIVATTRQQTIADVAKRKVSVEGATQSASPLEATLPSEERAFADAFAEHVPGLTRKGVAQQYEQIKRSRR